jgi:hypothetical protein
VKSGGRSVRAPCVPPHCFVRCATDAPCRTHPLVANWRPPSPRSCPRYGPYVGSGAGGGSPLSSSSSSSSSTGSGDSNWLIYPIVKIRLYPTLEKLISPNSMLASLAHQVFGIPEDDVIECVPYKSADFATVVPCTLPAICYWGRAAPSGDALCYSYTSTQLLPHESNEQTNL